MTEHEYGLFVENAWQKLNDLNQQLDRSFNLGHYERWDYQQESGEFVFSDQGAPKIVAKVQVVGSYSATAKTWLWAWANASIVESAREQISKVREFGILEGIFKLSDAKWSGEESDGWEMTAIAATLLSARGAYRAPTRAGFLFVIFTDVKKIAE